MILLGANETTEADTFIRELLEGVDLETLRRVEALMYSGRGDGSAVELRSLITQNHPTKEDVVRAITEKRSNLDLYFERGIDLAKAEGINLDTF
jgi:hypothetical protein